MATRSGHAASEADGSATVVVSQRVRPGREDDYAAWQEKMDEAARRFPGFKGTEAVPPVAGVQDEWVVVFRFDTTPHLLAWSDSPERAGLLAEGKPLFAGPTAQQVLAGEHVAKPVTAVISHRVSPDKEAEFLEYQNRLEEAERAFPGYQGSEVFRPVPGVQEDWTALFRFDSKEHLDAWMRSEERRRLLGDATCFEDYEVRTVGNTFGSWFPLSEGSQAPPAPSWKQAMTVLLALYPTVMILGFTLGAGLQDAHVPFWLAMFVSNMASVAALTWLLMPGVTRALRFWLQPAGASRRRQALGVAAVLAGYAVSLLVFALIP